MSVPRISPTTLAAILGTAGLALIVLDSPLGTVGRLLAWAVLAASCVVLVAFERSARTWLTPVQLLVAAIGLPVAAAYGGGHAFEGSVPAALVGITAALCWLSVLVVAGTRMIRAASWIGRIAAIPIVLIYAQFAIMPLAMGTAGAHAPQMPLTASMPAGASEVGFTTPGGVELHGWYTPTTNGSAVVLLPGSTGNRSSTVDHAAVLARHGYGVLAVDARGSGDSRGYGNMWGWTGLEDITGAINWLELQPGVDPHSIGLVGLSMGGEQAITVASLDHRVAAVVSEGVEARVPADLWYVGDDLRALTERAVSTLMWEVASLWSDAGQPASLRAAAAAIGRSPVLVIAADAPGERAVAADLASTSPRVEVWQTTGIGHVQSLALAPAEWESRVIGFLDRSL